MLGSFGYRLGPVTPKTPGECRIFVTVINRWVCQHMVRQTETQSVEKRAGRRDQQDIC
jgi:hypothetical protein